MIPHLYNYNHRLKVDNVHLQAAGMTLKREDYAVRVPRSQRGGEIVEPLVREQWFVRMQPLAQPALQVGHSTKQEFSGFLTARLQRCLFKMQVISLRAECLDQTLHQEGAAVYSRNIKNSM